MASRLATVCLLALVVCSVVALGRTEDKKATEAKTAAPTAQDQVPKVDTGLADQTKVGSKTDNEGNAREEEAMNYDGFSPAEVSALKGKEEKHEFQAEVSRLMDIIINSLYSNREIFIRELISNASDALDKIRFLSVTNKDALGKNPDLEIRIKFDRTAKTLTIRDTGVGMTKNELIQHLGVVANSGTTKFVEAAQSGKDALQLIGQFGVGFYSVYLVADRVTVVSKSNNDPVQHVWQSNAQQVFTVSEDPRGDTLGRGTEVILHLKDDATEYLDQGALERVIQKYSSFINFPIYLQTTKNVEKEVPDESAATEEKKEEPEKKDDDVEVSDDDKKKDEDKPKTKKITVEEKEWKQLNENKAIWTRKPKDVTEKEYEEFYKVLSKDYSGPLTHSHFTAEGEIAFKSILYIPKTAPHDLYDKYYGKSQSLKLYVRRVLISDEFEDFMPRYLSFIKGVVDSDDLPLNVSRETLSKSRVLKVMSKKLTRKALDMLRKLSDDCTKAEQEEKEAEKAKEEKKEGEGEGESDEDKKKAAEERKKKIDNWYTFWKQFSKSIKLGLIEDASNKSKLQKLLRFPSSKAEEAKPVSLQQYVDRMKEKQEHIYYITGESLEQVKNSPFLEQLKKRDFEVLYLVDPLDEYLMSNMPEFDGKKFMSATKEGLKFGDESEQEKKREENLNKHYEGLAKFLKELYGEKVEKVIVSKRVSQTPCVLVTSQYGWSANMERIMKAQTFADADRQKYMMSKKTMEINPVHPLIREMRERVAQNPADEKVKDAAQLMFDSAVLNSGFSIENPQDFAERIRRSLSASLNVDPAAPMLNEDDFHFEEAKEEPKEEAKDEKEEATKEEDNKDDL